MQFILSLRLRILYRTLAHAGWGLMLFVFLLSTVGILNFVYEVIEKPAYWWGFVLLLPALMWHFARKDRNFLLISGLPIKGVLMTDYFLVSFLPLCLLGLSNNWVAFGVLILGIIGLSFVPIPQKSKIVQINPALNWLPISFFEWRAGFRQNLAVLIFIYLITLVNCCFWEGGLVLSVLFLAGILASFYDFIENKDLLQQTFSTQNAFYKKLKQHLIITFLFILPHLLAYLAFFVKYWPIALACVLFLLSIVAFSLALKYALWYPDRKRVVQGIQHGLFVVGLLSAIFAVVSLGWLVILCRKANRNMNTYFSPTC
jgi:hypothetical protein